MELLKQIIGTFGLFFAVGYFGTAMITGDLKWVIRRRLWQDGHV